MLTILLLSPYHVAEVQNEVFRNIIFLCILHFYHTIMNVNQLLQRFLYTQTLCALLFCVYPHVAM